MTARMLRYAFPFLGPMVALLAVPAGFLAEELGDWLPKPAQTPGPVAFRRSLPIQEHGTENALRKELALVPEVGLAEGLDPEDQRELAEQLEQWRESHQARAIGRHQDARIDCAEKPSLPDRPEPWTVQEVAWLTLGLPARTNEDCQREPEAALFMESLARKMRGMGYVGSPGRTSRVDGPELLKLVRPGPNSPAPTFFQLLQSEDESSRLALVEALNRLDGIRAVIAIARQAVFDLSPKVRSRATALLAERPRDLYRQELLDAFRHPWPPAANHAADALVALNDREAVPALRELLGEPNPSAPEDERTVRELVRVNHLKNCLLCHAPSRDENDLVRGPIPSPDQPLPIEYYRNRRPDLDDLFVRADITYLRQDFSVILPVKDAKPWPEMQRFDFLVRTRPATAAELKAKRAGNKSPQRQAVWRALKALLPRPGSAGGE